MMNWKRTTVEKLTQCNHIHRKFQNIVDNWNATEHDIWNQFKFDMKIYSQIASDFV